MNLHDHMIQKYSHYEAMGMRLFAATLSTYVKSSWYMKTRDVRSLWQEHFIYRITRHLPYKEKKKIDHDFVIESAFGTSCGYHFHGIVALTATGGERVWCNGVLHKQLVRDFDSLQRQGISRPCRVNKYLVEPIQEGKLHNWIKYVNKESNLIASSVHFPQ